VERWAGIERKMDQLVGMTSTAAGYGGARSRTRGAVSLSTICYWALLSSCIFFMVIAFVSWCMFTEELLAV
jgi:hypothetical protein